MKKEQLINLYDKSSVLEKWQLISETVRQDLMEVCPPDSYEFLHFA